ncbi:Dual-specificity RNA methyltransferase RlmN [Galdieria sulphuraria]|nr:Dual-specificity RNA methyltransferase RlmN [Galdieria sulphuraria]
MDCFVRPFVTFSTNRSLRLFQRAVKTTCITLAYTNRKPWRQPCLRASFQSNTSRTCNDAKLVDNHQPCANENRQVNIHNKVLLKGFTLEKMQLWLESLGEKKFRALQLWKWLYQQQGGGVDNFNSMTNLSKQFREKMEQIAVVDSLQLENVYEAQDGTKKLAFRLKSRDSDMGSGGIVEAVLIPNDSWVTLCVSSQLGCAQRCQFCYTAKMGLHGHLHTAEIVDQVVIAKRLFEKEKRISNIVFMGMGEPLHNIDNVLTAIEILLDEQGLHLSHNKVTVSTSGLVPEMERLAKETKVNLALSLNATTDEVRDELMPINRKYPIKVLLNTPGFLVRST